MEVIWNWGPLKRSTYWKNQRSLQELEDQLLSHMKGYDWSFRKEITDEKGAFSQEKLCALVETMLSLWAEDLRLGSAMDPAAGERVAESYLRARLELYRLYLCLVMRCSLYPGGYKDARNGSELKERADFAFLLAQARRLLQNWCVVTGKDGARRNEPYYGFDEHFGFHLYRALCDPEGAYGQNGNDWSLTPDWQAAYKRPLYQLTDEGNTKRISIRQFSGLHRPSRTEDAEDPAPPEEVRGAGDAHAPEEDTCGLEEDAYDPAEEACDPEEDAYDPAEDDGFWDSFPEEDNEAWLARIEQLSQEDERQQGLMLLCGSFACRQEYLSACEDFKKRFAQARPEVLWGFCADLEEIVDLYLVDQGIPPLMDTDKALDVCGRIREGALRQAERYGRGIQWENL